MHWRRRDKDLFLPASDERNFPDIKLPVNKSQRVGLVYDPFLEFQWIVIRMNTQKNRHKERSESMRVSIYLYVECGSIYARAL